MPSPNPARQTQRYNNTGASQALATDSTSPVFTYEMCGKGGYLCTAVATAVTITYWVCGASSGTFIQLYDRTNTAVTQTIAVNKAYPLPAELEGFPFFQMRIDAGTASVTMSQKF